jgi:Fe-S cluster biogenesis protein NfuA
MAEEMKISGELTPDPRVCRFTVEQPVVEPGWTVVFERDEGPHDSPLAAALFAIDGVVLVRVQGNEVFVTKNAPAPWPELAARVVAALRTVLQNGEAPVSQAALDEVKNAPAGDIEPLVQRLFDEYINPALASHGGFARVVKVEDRDVHVEMGGGCQGCAASQATLRHGIEAAIRQVAPQVREVIDVTDHAAGANPFYS